MSMLDARSYNELETRFGQCLSVWKPAISKEAHDHVNHYVNHGELAMAVESLVLSCIVEMVPCPQFVKSTLLSICKDLSLETDSVFDSGFWGKLCEYLER